MCLSATDRGNDDIAAGVADRVGASMRRQRHNKGEPEAEESDEAEGYKRVSCALHYNSISLLESKQAAKEAVSKPLTRRSGC